MAWIGTDRLHRSRLGMTALTVVVRFCGTRVERAKGATGGRAVRLWVAEWFAQDVPVVAIARRL